MYTCGLKRLPDIGFYFLAFCASSYSVKNSPGYPFFLLRSSDPLQHPHGMTVRGDAKLFSSTSTGNDGFVGTHYALYNIIQYVH